MRASEAKEFEENPLSELMIKMREWDDLAKVTEQPVIDINIITQKIKNVLR